MDTDNSDKNRRSDQEDDRKIDQDNGNGNGENKDRLDAKHPKQKPREDATSEDQTDDDEASKDAGTETVQETDSQVDSQADSQNEDNTPERKTWRCNRKSPGSYAKMHKGSAEPKAKTKRKTEDKTKITQISQKKIILQLQQENQELKDKLNEEQQEHDLNRTSDQETNQQKIRELEAEVDVLINQIQEYDDNDNMKHQQKIKTLTEQLTEATDLEEVLQNEIDNLKQKIQELEEENEKLSQTNTELNRKLKEATKKAKESDKAAQKAKNEKRILEQVAEEKSQEIATLKGNIESLQEQMDQTSPTSQQEPEPQPQQSIILLGDSNCRDIQPHLMTWTNQAVEMVWAPKIQDAKNWTTANGDEIGDRIVVILVGTNDMKTQKNKNEISAMHKEVTQAISEKGAQLIVAQLPPVYHPQPRAESRRWDTELINEILLERHGQTTALADKITLHRRQMKKDGLHITNESAEIMAEQITEAINRSEQQTTNRNLRITIKNDSNRSAKDNLEDTTQLTTTKQIAAKIIGKGGDRIRKIKTLYNVEIDTTETDEDHRTFSIKGARKDTTKVHRVLQEIAIDTEEQDKEQKATETYTNAPPKRTTKIPVICRFYLEGKCTRGNNCKFIHEAGPADITISTEHSTTSEDEEPSPEPSPVRKISIKPKTTSKDIKASKSRDDPPAHHKRKQRTPPQTQSKHKHRRREDTPEETSTSRRHDSPSTSQDQRHHKHHRKEDRHEESSHSRRHRSSSRTKRSSKRDAPSSSKGRRTPLPHTSKHRKDRKSPQRERSRRDDSREKSRDRYDRRTPSPYRPDKYAREKSRERYDRRTPSPNRLDKYSSRRYRPSPEWRERTPSPDRSRSRSSNRRRSRSHSPHREATRYRHQPRSYDEKDLERAISNILARRGLR